MPRRSHFVSIFISSFTTSLKRGRETSFELFLPSPASERRQRKLSRRAYNIKYSNEITNSKSVTIHLRKTYFIRRTNFGLFLLDEISTYLSSRLLLARPKKMKEIFFKILFIIFSFTFLRLPPSLIVIFSISNELKQFHKKVALLLDSF